MDNKTIIIPNGKLFNEVIVNVSRENIRRLDFDVRIGYAADVDIAKDIITKAIENNDKVLKDPAPRVGLVGLNVDNLQLTVNVWITPADYLVVKIALMEKIIRDLRLAGVSFPKPG